LKRTFLGRFILFFTWNVSWSLRAFGAPDKDCTVIDQCSCRLSDGSMISLWPIDNGTEPRFVTMSPGGIKFLYSPCTPIRLSIIPEDCKNSLICKIDSQKAGSMALSVAFADTMVSIYDKSFNGYIFSYSGSKIDQKTILKSMVKLNCDSSAATPKITDFMNDSTNTFVTTLTSRYACVIKSKKKGLSVGSTLCILFFSVAFTYIAFGMMLNKSVLHKSGLELLPHKSFWCAVASYVKDGFLFTFHKIRGRSGQYEMI